MTGPANTNECRELSETFTDLCGRLNVPLAEEKSLGPVTCMEFLGLEIDSLNRCIRIPHTKIQ